jgi:hypothetical protein
LEQCQQAGLVWGKELYIDARHPSRPMLHPNCRRRLSSLPPCARPSWPIVMR